MRLVNVLVIVLAMKGACRPIGERWMSRSDNFLIKTNCKKKFLNIHEFQNDS